VRNSRRMIDDDHAENVVFTCVLSLKVVDYALQFATTLGIGSPFGQLAAPHLIDLGHSRANESKIIEVAKLQPPAPWQLSSDTVKGEFRASFAAILNQLFGPQRNFDVRSGRSSRCVKELPLGKAAAGRRSHR
jgi:hypothetical protein